MKLSEFEINFAFYSKVNKTNQYLAGLNRDFQA